MKSLIFFPPTKTTGTGAIWRGKRKFRGTGPSESVGTDPPSQTPMAEFSSGKPRWPTNLFDLLNLHLFWILLHYIVRHEAIQFCKQVVFGFFVFLLFLMLLFQYACVSFILFNVFYTRERFEQPAKKHHVQLADMKHSTAGYPQPRFFTHWLLVVCHSIWALPKIGVPRNG